VSALVLVLVGTDHHPFERLVAWADATAARHADARVVVQHGWTRAPRVAEGHQFLPHERIAELLVQAAAVVCHGGPGTIVDARDAGHVPICVPRDPRLGEHVDGHQLRFAGLVGTAGVVRTVTGPADFETTVDELLHTGTSGRRPAGERDAATHQARSLLAAELDGLLRPPPPMPRRRRRVALLRGGSR